MSDQRGRPLGRSRLVPSGVVEPVRWPSAEPKPIPVPPVIEEMRPVAAPLTSESADPLGGEFLTRGLAIIRQQLGDLAARLDQPPEPGAGNWHDRMEHSRLLVHLASKGMAMKGAEAVLERAGSAHAGTTLAENVCTVLRSGIQSRSLAMDVQIGSALAFVGPAGSGKTSALVKAAIRHAVAVRRPVHLFAVDNIRIDGARQLRRYAKLIGADFSETDSATLAARLRAIEPATLAMIDTPAFKPGGEGRASDLATRLAECGASVQLVVPASMNGVDLTRIVDRYRVFNPVSFIFTRLDETECVGLPWSEAWRTGIPLSALSTGPDIPDDLMEVSVNDLAAAVMSGFDQVQRRGSARMAATA